MNLKTELVALAVRYLSENTNTVRRPDSFNELLTTITTGKTHDERVAEDIVAAADKLIDFAKKTYTVRKFKKSIPDHV